MLDKIYKIKREKSIFFKHCLNNYNIFYFEKINYKPFFNYGGIKNERTIYGWKRIF